MKRELAFALQVQSQLAGSLGRTRASKVHIQSGDLSEVAEVRGRKRIRGSVANESELNCEVGGSREKSEVNLRKVRGRQFNGTAVYRRTRRSKNAADWEEEQKVSVAERIETAVEGKSKCNLVTPCEDESKGDLAEASINLELRDDNENPTANEVDSEVVAMAVDKSNGVRNGESDEVTSDGIIEVRSDVPVECLRSALNSTWKVELAECSVSVAPGSGLMDGGENESVLNVEVNGSPDVGASVTPTKKLELKMSKKISMGRTPRTVKELFATGLLEGYSVFYNGGNKGFALRGMIKDVGILCFCSSCNGSQVVNPCQFEIHACKSYRRAAQYICLENGKSLLEVVKACRSSRLDTLEETIQSVIGKLPEKESIICQNCKGSFLATFAEKVKQLCELCVESNNLEATPADVKQHCEPCLESKSLEASPIDTTDANDRSLEPDLALRRSTRTQCTLAQDDSQGSIRDDRLFRSPALVVMPKSPASGSAHILSQRESREKTIRKSLKPALAPISSGSASVPICSRNKSQVGIAQKRSRSASVLKPSASTLMCISSKCNRRGKITKKLPKLVSARKSYRGASVHKIFSETRRQHKITKRSSKAVLSTGSSKSASQCTSPPQKSKWKITKKDLRLHKLVFEEDGLPEGTEVAYYSNGQKLLEGYKRGLGILCHCCNSEVSASQFEAHAGWASRRKPYSYIYTSNGVSLHEFAISLLKGRKHCAKDNDDLCIICADGGNLLLCDGCPRAFHIECAALSSIPRGKWYCNYCQNMFQREKFVERNANAVAAGRVSGVDPIEQITKRCMRIVKNPEDAEVIACVLCRGYDFSKSGFGPRTVIVCDQCEREYHVGCLKKHKMADLKELPKGTWFCCMDCGKIYSALQNLLVRGEEKIPDSLLDVIRKKHDDKASNVVTDFDVRWRLLSGKIASPETRLLLSKAVAIFHECFDPIVDFATGRDFIPSMVYGRNIRGQDFGGMYCAILTVNSSVVSAGIFRVFGREIAELPLVATSNGNQGKGYFQLLFSCIEKLFAFLNVKSLVLPAADEAESIWTNKFGFEKIPPEQLSKYRKTCWQMLTFKGTSMLQKMVPQCRIIEQNVDVPMESN